MFIPEGFWHQIDSQPGTIAVNIWWESAVQLMLLGTDSEQFYLRRLLQAAVIEKQERLLDADIAGHPELLAVQRTSNAGNQICLLVSPSPVDSSACDARRSREQSSMHMIVMHGGMCCMNKGIPPSLENNLQHW